jgi:ribokinase
MSRLFKDLGDRNEKSILVIGSANVDMIMGLPRLPEKGETVTDGVFMQTFGGKGANQAVAASRSGAAVSMLCCLGDDDYGRAVSDALAADRIDLTWMVRTKNAATGAALVMFDSVGANYLAVAPGANYMLEPEHVLDCMRGAAHWSMILLQCEIPERTLHAALLAANEAGVPVLFNYAPARTLMRALVPGPNCGIVVNEIEASTLTGVLVEESVSAFKSARELRQRGYKFVIVTLGAQGACLTSGDGEWYIPAIPVNAVDSTAAGDSFCGALAAAMAEGHALHDAVRFATVAASLCVQRSGAQPSIPHRQDIDEIYVQLDYEVKNRSR